MGHHSPGRSLENWTLDLYRKTPYTYYADGYRLEDEKTKCAFLLAINDEIVEESQFRLIDSSTVFAAKALALKEAISDTHRKVLG